MKETTYIWGFPEISLGNYYLCHLAFHKCKTKIDLKLTLDILTNYKTYQDISYVTYILL